MIRTILRLLALDTIAHTLRSALSRYLPTEADVTRALQGIVLIKLAGWVFCLAGAALVITLLVGGEPLRATIATSISGFLVLVGIMRLTQTTRR